MDVIQPTMLVAEINRQYPACRAVFDAYGLGGCGGADGPAEPLFIFAAAHRVALPDLVAQLNAAVRGEWKPPRPTPTEDFAAENLYKQFVFAALAVALTAGFGLGLVNLLRICAAGNYAVVDGLLKQYHGHAQVFGWVGLFIMGVAYHAVPRMKGRAVWSVNAVRASLWLVVAGLVVRLFGSWFTVLGAGLELAGVLTFVGLIANVVIGSEQERETYEKFIFASVGWLLALAVGDVWLAWQGRPALGQALWIHAALFGFIANMIFGFSLRVLPHFLGLQHTKTWAANAAFVLWNAAIFCRYPTETLAWIASGLEAVATVLFVYALGIFAKRRVQIEIAGVDGTFVRFLYLGYGWLLLNAGAPFHADIYRLSASARHTMALGFITPVIFGVAYRILPIFNGVNLWSARLMRVTFWLLAAGSTLSLAMAFNKAFPVAWSFAWSGIAGTCAFAALVCFAVNLFQTLRSRAVKFVRGAAVEPTTRVADLLEAYPTIRPVLIHGGLSGLATLRHGPPRFVTIEFAARRHGIDPQPLIATLNQEIARQ